MKTKERSLQPDSLVAVTAGNSRSDSLKPDEAPIAEEANSAESCRTEHGIDVIQKRSANFGPGTIEFHEPQNIQDSVPPPKRTRLSEGGAAAADSPVSAAVDSPSPRFNSLPANDMAQSSAPIASTPSKDMTVAELKATGPHWYKVHSYVVHAFEMHLATCMVDWEETCRLSDIIPGGKFASAEECRQGDHALSLLLADFRLQMGSSINCIKSNGRLLHALQSMNNYAHDNGGNLFIDFVQRDVLPSDVK